MTALNRSQQDNIFDPAAARPVTVIGAGSVGSQVVCSLAKIGVERLRVFDHDCVESHNICMSAYRPADLGVYKVRALAEIVREQSGLDIVAEERRYAGEPLRDAVVACVDSMAARRLIWEAVRQNPNVGILVDTRVAIELVSVFAVNPSDQDDIAYYEHFLYPDEAALRPMCGEHGLDPVAKMATALAVMSLTNVWTYGKTRRHLKWLAGEMKLLAD